MEAIKGLELLLEDGRLALFALQESMAFEMKSRMAMEKDAETRALAIVRNALELTEAEFQALQPSFIDGDEGYRVVLQAYGHYARLELRGFDWLRSEDSSDAMVQVAWAGSSRFDSTLIGRQELALWLARMLEAAERDEIFNELQEKNFTPFVYYRVWYGNGNHDYYNLRNLPKHNEDCGLTVDQPFQLVFVPQPIRMEQIVVSEVKDLPGWCPVLEVTIRGRGMKMVVPPSWARSTEADGWLTADEEDIERWVEA